MINIESDINSNKEIFIELTDKCNLSCSYCNKHYGNNFIDLELFEKLIKQITTNYIKQVDFLCLWWGEPFLHPQFEEILNILDKYCKNIDKKFKIAINTNWILLKTKSDLLYKFIKKLKNIDFMLYISLDWLWIDWNSNRGITNKQYSLIIDSIDYVNENFNLSNFELNISSVLSLQDNNLGKINNFTTIFEEKWININFCFQEIMWWTKSVLFSKEIFQNLLKNYLFLIKKWYKVVIESNQDMNSTIRINSKWHIYNFIDESFNWSEDFLISKNWDLLFLTDTNWYKTIPNIDIWNIIYIDKQYISLIEKIYKN